jgi:hypothetical protein
MTHVAQASGGIAGRAGATAPGGLAYRQQPHGQMDRGKYNRADGASGHDSPLDLGTVVEGELVSMSKLPQDERAS